MTPSSETNSVTTILPMSSTSCPLAAATWEVSRFSRAYALLPPHLCRLAPPGRPERSFIHIAGRSGRDSKWAKKSTRPLPPSGTLRTPKGGSHCGQWAISFFRQSVDIHRQNGSGGVVRIGVSGQERGEHYVSESTAH